MLGLGIDRLLALRMPHRFVKFRLTECTNSKLKLQTLANSEILDMRAYVGVLETVGWYFGEEWEIVPGEWIIQIKHNDKILAEKKFNIITEENNNSAPGGAL